MRHHPYTSEEDDLLSNFFTDKVAIIRSAIDQRLEDKQKDSIRADNLFIGIPLSGLKLVSHTEVKQILHAMTGKSSPRGFISTNCSGVFASVIAQLANLSFFDTKQSRYNLRLLR